MAPTIGLAKRNANQKKLVNLLATGLFFSALCGQTADINWNNSGAQGLLLSDSLIYVNEITAEELLRHPLLTQDEGLSIIQHRTQFGEILELMELQQCRFTTNRLMELRPYLVFSPSTKLARAAWLQELRSAKGNHSYSNTYYPNRLTSTPNSLGGPWGHSLQLRWNQGQTLSVGGSLQLDPGETIRGLQSGIGLGHASGTAMGSTTTSAVRKFGNIYSNFPFRQWHMRLGNLPLGRRLAIDKLVLGKYNLQLGQGLVQGGLSGFWSAPLLWARKSPDWDLAEKRGFDEYRGHTGVAVAFHFGMDGANKSRLGLGHGKKMAGHMQFILAFSDDKISARTDSLGRIQSLISDGMFGTESALRWFRNTTQWQGTMALQYQSLRRSTYGISWSGYRYSREWNSVSDWVDLSPALRAGLKFHYPQFWCTHFQKSGGMWFMNVAMQWQSLKSDFDSTTNLSNTASAGFPLNHAKSQPHGMANPNSKILTSTELQSTFYPMAFVMGYVKPMGKKSDLSFRFYAIQRNFRPPQGLFNEFQRNHERLSLTFSSTPNARYSVKYGAEIGKNLRYDGSGEKPVTVSYQLGVSAKYSKEWSSELLWQLRRNSDPLAGEYDAATHYWGSDGFDSRMEYGGLHSGRSQNSYAFRGRTTVVARYRPAEGWAVAGKFSLLPTNSPLPPNGMWPLTPNSNYTDAPNQNISNQPPQNTVLFGIPNADQTTPINPTKYKNAMLAAISITHRKPFTPLKITFETLCYQSNSPLYHQPTTTATEIANYVLSGQGYGANCLVEYSFKFKTHSTKNAMATNEKSIEQTEKSNTPTPSSKTIIHKTHHAKIQNHKVQTAFRAEFLHKNNSQFPNQPRIFVTLCWK